MLGRRPKRASRNVIKTFNVLPDAWDCFGRSIVKLGGRVGEEQDALRPNDPLLPFPRNLKSLLETFSCLTALVNPLLLLTQLFQASCQYTTGTAHLLIETTSCTSRMHALSLVWLGRCFVLVLPFRLNSFSTRSQLRLPSSSSQAPNSCMT